MPHHSNLNCRNDSCTYEQSVHPSVSLPPVPHNARRLCTTIRAIAYLLLRRHMNERMMFIHRCMYTRPDSRNPSSEVSASCEIPPRFPEVQVARIERMHGRVEPMSAPSGGNGGPSVWPGVLVVWSLDWSILAYVFLYPTSYHLFLQKRWWWVSSSCLLAGITPPPKPTDLRPHTRDGEPPF